MKEELQTQIEDDKFGLYTVDGKWLFECREKNDIGHWVTNLNSIMYLMSPARPILGGIHYTVGIKIPASSSDEFILDKVQIAKRDYDQYKHEVNLDGGDLGTASL